MSASRTAVSKTIEELEAELDELRSGPQDHSTDIEITKVLCDLAYATYRSDPARAEALASEAMVSSERSGFIKGTAECHTLFGTLAWTRGNFIRAAECYSRALKLCEESGNRKGIASCYSNLANVRRNRGDYEQALELHFKSLSIKEELNDKIGMAKSYNNIGIIYDEWKNHGSALEFYNRALLQFEELDDLQGIAISRNNMGNVYETMEEYSKAIDEYLLSVEIKERIGDRKGIADSYLNIGTLHSDQGDGDLALEYCLKALDIFEEIDDRRGSADSRNQIGNIYTGMERFDSAMVYLQEGLEQSVQIGCRELESESSRYLAELHRARGDYEKSLERLMRYTELREELFGDRAAETIARMQVRYETEKIEKEAEIYRSVLERTLVGFYRITPEGHILLVNNSFARMLGYSSPDEVLYRNLRDLRKDSSLPIPTSFLNTLEEDEIIGQESVLRQRDGTEIHVRENRRSIRDDTGSIVFCEGTVEDITDLKNAEEAILESEEVWRSMADNTPAFITIVDRDLVVSYINHPVPGLSKEEVKGRSVLDFVEPEFHGIIREKTDRVFQTGKTEFFSSRATGPEGSIAYYENYLGAIRKGEEVVSVTLIGIDITERMRADAERERLIHDIEDRVKALDCLYGLSRLAENQENGLDSIFLGLVELIPPAWHYPEHTCARIVIEEGVFESNGFQETLWKQEAAILVDGREKGLVQVFYTREFPEAIEGPFRREERHLINELADRIGNLIHRKQAVETLAAEQRRLTYILEGTNVGTWEWNIQTGETSFNERWAEIIGYDLEELSPVSIGTWMELLHHDDRKITEGLLNRHFAGDIDYFECEVRMSHKIGAWVWVLDRGKVISRADDGTPLLMAGTREDITSRKLAESRVEHLATHDALTELPTMRLAKDRMSMTLDLARRNGTMAAVMFADLDDFKLVNDRYGHEAGDNLLKVISERFLSSVRKVDTVARIGGDEFLIIVSELRSQRDAALIAENLVKIAAQPVSFHEDQMTTGASIGISIYPDNSGNADTLIKLADTAMYLVKGSGKNGYTFS
ncbi:MAG: PAS domain S-box protein [Candidatus Fermentibacteraceae bacterium]|nr:PAS domain S-box protein [Candidatus Fermentibacteraceae bacterium]MBN2859665.1 PAS domain S-box protein [Sphaerochaetaceae bacterium]